MKNLVWMAGIGLALTLTACNSKDDSPKASTFSSYSGTVVEPSSSSTQFVLVPQAWTGGAGTIEGYVKVNQTAQKFTSGSLKADGNFSIDLPTPPTETLEQIGEEDAGLLESSDKCSNNTLHFSNKDAKMAVLELKTVTDKASEEITNVTYSYSNNALNMQTGNLIYMDRDVSMTGNATCISEEEGIQHITYNARFSKGWNKATIQISLQKSGASITSNLALTSGKLPSNQWYIGAKSDAIPLGFINLSKLGKHN